MNQTSKAIFPSQGLQALSSFLYMFGVSILAHCISRRSKRVGRIAAWSWARICTLLIFVDSWLFLFTSGLVIFGIGLETSPGVCTSAILVCSFFYGTSKVLVYLFFAERVYIVWQPPLGAKRLSTPIYIACIATLLLYIPIFVLMITGRIHHIREDGICVIGIKSFSSIPILVYDLYITVFLTTLFLLPILRSTLPSPRVYRMAKRTFVASFIALTTSSVNILMILILEGHQFGWLCLGCCGIDVIVNALVLFWVSTSPTPTSTSRTPNGNPETPHEAELNSAEDPHEIQKTSYPSQLACVPSLPKSTYSRFSAFTTVLSRDNRQDRNIELGEFTSKHNVDIRDTGTNEESLKS